MSGKKKKKKKWDVTVPRNNNLKIRFPYKLISLMSAQP